MTITMWITQLAELTLSWTYAISRHMASSTSELAHGLDHQARQRQSHTQWARLKARVMRARPFVSSSRACLRLTSLHRLRSSTVDSYFISPWSSHHDLNVRCLTITSLHSASSKIGHLAKSLNHELILIWSPWPKPYMTQGLPRIATWQEFKTPELILIRPLG